MVPLISFWKNYKKLETWMSFKMYYGDLQKCLFVINKRVLSTVNARIIRIHQQKWIVNENELKCLCSYKLLFPKIIPITNIQKNIRNISIWSVNHFPIFFIKLFLQVIQTFDEQFSELRKCFKDAIHNRLIIAIEVNQIQDNIFNQRLQFKVFGHHQRAQHTHLHFIPSSQSYSCFFLECRCRRILHYQVSLNIPPTVLCTFDIMPSWSQACRSSTSERAQTARDCGCWSSDAPNTEWSRWRSSSSLLWSEYASRCCTPARLRTIRQTTTGCCPRPSGESGNQSKPKHTPIWQRMWLTTGTG